MANHAATDYRCTAHFVNGRCQETTDINRTPHFLEHLLDMADTLADIMVICGIHKRKAKDTIEIIIDALLHYDEIDTHVGTRPTKRLRREVIFLELGRRCMMDLAEAHLCYNIIKRGFKAFYYVPSPGEPVTALECNYVCAAKKTAQYFTHAYELHGAEKQFYKLKIRSAYKKFWHRYGKREKRTEDEVCQCCFCTKREHKISAKMSTCAEKAKENLHDECPPKEKAPFIHAGRVIIKCPNCRRPRRCCICTKVKFDLNYVQSIWHRDDFDHYYTSHIHNNAPGCKEWKCDCPETKGCRKSQQVDIDIESELKCDGDFSSVEGGEEEMEDDEDKLECKFSVDII